MAFGLKKFRNEDAMKDEKNEASGEQSNMELSRATRREDLQRWESTTSTISPQICRLSVFIVQLTQYKSILISHYKKISLICTRESKKGVN